MKKSDDSSPLLTPFQKQVVSSAITFASILAIIGFIVFSFILISKTVQNFSKVIWPLSIASVLTVILKPCIDWMSKKLRLNPTTSILVLYLFIGLTLLTLTLLLVPQIIEQTIMLLQYLPELAVQLWGFLQERFPEVFVYLQEEFGFSHISDYTDKIFQAFRTLVENSIPAIATISSELFGFMNWLLALAIIPIYLFYLLKSERSTLGRIKGELSFIKGEWGKDLIFLLEELSHILVAFFRGQLLIALIMGAAFAIGFSFINLQFGLILGLSLGLLNIIPYLGSITGAMTLLPIAYFQEGGGIKLVLLSFLVMGIVQTIEGYILTPKIMGKQTGLHPMTIIIAIFFWGTALSGVLGMILAIPLTAFLVVFWRLLQRKYLTR